MRSEEGLAEANSADVDAELHISVDLECGHVDDRKTIRPRRLERHFRARPPRIRQLVLAVVVVDGVGLAVNAVVRDLGFIVAEKLEGVVVRVGGGVEDGDGVVAVKRDRLRAHGRLVSQETHLATIGLVGKRFSVSEVGREPLVSAGPGSAVEREVFALVVSGGFGIDAGLVFADVTVNLNGIVGVSTVGVDPVHTVGQIWLAESQISARVSGVLFSSRFQGGLLDDLGNIDESL